MPAGQRDGSAHTILFIIATTYTTALDNGFRTPPLGWSSWYGFTKNIDETMLRGMADAMVSSGLHAAGYNQAPADMSLLASFPVA